MKIYLLQQAGMQANILIRLGYTYESADMIKGEAYLIHSNLLLSCPYDKDLSATAGRKAS